MSFDSDGTLLWPLPKQKTWCVCCVLLWDRVHVFSPYIQSPKSKFIPVHKTYLSIFHRSSFISVWWFYFCYFYLFRPFSPTLCSSNLFIANCACPLSSQCFLFPLSIKTHFLCTTCIMTDWWLPLQYRSVIIKSLALVPMNLQQVCLHTDCKLFHIWTI